MARPSKYRPEFVEQAEKLCKLGATDLEVADFFEVEPDEEAFFAKWLELRRQDRFGVLALQKREHAKARAARRRHPSNRVVAAMRARIWAAVKGRSDGRLFQRTGYSRQQLMDHLEKAFVEGMSWDNYGKWHIDHIKPCARFDQADPAQFAECWALANLQPLWASENTRKGAKYGPA